MNCGKIFVFLGMKQEKTFGLAEMPQKTDISPHSDACH
jgi:hypothetical protein